MKCLENVSKKAPLFNKFSKKEGNAPLLPPPTRALFSNIKTPINVKFIQKTINTIESLLNHKRTAVLFVQTGNGLARVTESWSQRILF